MNRIHIMLALSVASLLSSEAIIAGVEKWIDSDGRVHYGDRPPAGVRATPVDVRHNVIDTGFNVPEMKAAKPAVRRQWQPEPNPASVRNGLQSYIENCRNNRGVDCELEARQMIDGPAPVIFPGDPAVFPRPDLRPPPPGLPLKYSITP